MSQTGPRRLRTVFWVCLLLFIPCLFLWLTNVKVGLASMFGFNLPWIVDTDGTLLAALTADWSTVSTFIPLIVIFYPLWEARRRLKGASGSVNPNWPYRAWTGRFALLLGLFGTILGMWVALKDSGIDASLGAVAASQVKLSRLMSGTSIALLSTLYGMIGAAVVAKPALPRLLQSYTAIGPGPDEGEQSLEDALDAVTGRFRSLFEVVGRFMEQLDISRLGQVVQFIKSVAGGIAELLHIAKEALKGVMKLNDTISALLSVASAQLAEQREIRKALVAISTRLDVNQSSLRRALGNYLKEISSSGIGADRGSDDNGRQ